MIKRVKLTEFGEQQLEALGLAAAMEFELEDGSTVKLVHPWLWSDEVQKAYDAVKNDGSLKVAQAILGKDVHKKLIAGGGSSNQVALALEMLRRGINLDETAEDADDPKD